MTGIVFGAKPERGTLAQVLGKETFWDFGKLKLQELGGINKCHDFRAMTMGFVEEFLQQPHLKSASLKEWFREGFFTISNSAWASTAQDNRY